MMDNGVKKYLSEELGMSERMIPDALEKIKRYDDIYLEFVLWLHDRSFNFEKPLEVGGYTAKQLAELNPNFSGLGVYNFMVTLRERPEVAQRYIDEGFLDI